MYTTTLAGRLLCASRAAYAAQGGKLPDCPPYSAAVGFTAPPATFVGGTNAIDACLLGPSADGLVLAFRGTLPPHSPNHRQTIEDWLNDLECELVKRPELPGLVHKGFCRSMEGLWLDLEPAITQQMNAKPGQKLLITGHSKGGALAHLAAARLAFSDGMAPEQLAVCTFAAPRPGDADFAATYQQKIVSITRYEYADDIVPHLPPDVAMRRVLRDLPPFDTLQNEFDYVSVGELRFIDWDGHVVGESPLLNVQRMYHLARLLTELGFDKIVADHSIDCGSGYMSALCPAGVCP